jgi:hypothetical protein
MGGREDRRGAVGVPERESRMDIWRPRMPRMPRDCEPSFD